MNTPNFTAFLESYAPLIRNLAAISRLDIDDVRHFAFELIDCAIRKGKGIGWVIRSLQRTCRHAGLAPSFVSMNDLDQAWDCADSTGLTPEDVLLMAEAHELRLRQQQMLGSNCALILDAFTHGTEGFAIQMGITQRRAQQILKDLVCSIESAKSNDEMISTLSHLAARVQRAALTKNSEQKPLWKEMP
ncbi:hypothetical protein [uncultured Propionivibrio sp.]|uniref:hypothetical protein n=1 Tax=uncultured Propionivibrio sp. TaxID=426737 RepID=UPI0029C06676|nr:hypothetical protein [uncultured Propionivibrio sp.]